MPSRVKIDKGGNVCVMFLMDEGVKKGMLVRINLTRFRKRRNREESVVRGRVILA